ncbi:uncharacterized protein DNG_09712 [Cephalotrichum gorgonifer]|uniref:NACHT domain-containing protein n=1 Tax=Cephalotrichum gorgonifer TaxID=2041049 RepID=A0AAE8SZP2_9PEZI|nr:uncharacterized protein DNG_09712 [Cephalotrichum gorgonifer]
MDPFAALSTAAALAQFVELGARLISKAHDIYSSAAGMAEEDEQLGFIVDRLSSLSKSAISKEPYGMQTDAAKSLAVVADKCQQLSAKLLEILERTKAKDPNSRRQSAVAALKSMWSEKEKKELKEQADDCRNLLHVQLTLVMGSETVDRLRKLAETGQSNAEDLNSLRKHVAIIQDGVTVSSLSSEVETQIESLFKLSRQALNSITSHRILNCLSFSDMHGRYNNVPGAHSSTFEWIFDNAVQRRHEKALEGRTLFREWLESGDDVFHISAKPGAGKSTLMKFLIRHPSTRDLLETWAAGRKLVIAKFFFWKPGKQTEHSIPSMLRTLLYDSLEQCPALFTSVLPSQWCRVDSLPWQAPVELQFSDEEILGAFDRLITHISTTKDERFCFFIDGLDEFEPKLGESYKSLVRQISDWTARSGGNLKFCVSSREFDVFLESFKGPCGLKLQDLTRDDMEKVTRDTLERNSDFQALEKPENGTEHLISLVLNKANGVFLWVSLVVSLLDQSCDDGDTFSELERKVHALHPEIKKLFRQLLDSVHESDRARSAQTFAIVLELQREMRQISFSLIRYSFLDDYIKNTEFASDVDELEKIIDMQGDEARMNSRLRRARKQLYKNCKGLLEIGRPKNNFSAGVERPWFESYTSSPDDFDYSKWQGRKWRESWDDWWLERENGTLGVQQFTDWIVLTHRDIHEFLMDEEIQQDRFTLIHDFDVLGAICQTFTAEATLCIPASLRLLHQKPMNALSMELQCILRQVSIQQDASCARKYLAPLNNLDLLRSQHKPLESAVSSNPDMTLWEAFIHLTLTDRVFLQTGSPEALPIFLEYGANLDISVAVVKSDESDESDEELIMSRTSSSPPCRTTKIPPEYDFYPDNNVLPQVADFIRSKRGTANLRDILAFLQLPYEEGVLAPTGQAIDEADGQESSRAIDAPLSSYPSSFAEDDMAMPEAVPPTAGSEVEEDDHDTLAGESSTEMEAGSRKRTGDVMRNPIATFALAMSGRSSTSTTLLGLPLELRREIYTLLFRQITIHSDKPGENHRLAVLHVCRQIYLEAAPLLPNVTVYCWGNAAVIETLTRIGPARISQLRHLIVTHVPIGFHIPPPAESSGPGTVGSEEEREDTVGDDDTDPDYNGMDDDDNIRYFQIGSILGLFPGLQLDLLEVFASSIPPGEYSCYETVDCLATLLDADGYRRLWMYAACGKGDPEEEDRPEHVPFGPSSADRWDEIITRKFKPYVGWKVKIDLTEWDRQGIFRGPEWGPWWARPQDTGTRSSEAPFVRKIETHPDGHGGEDLADIVVDRGNADLVVKSGDVQVLTCIRRPRVRDAPLFFRKASEALRKLFEENAWEDIKAMSSLGFVQEVISLWLKQAEAILGEICKHCPKHTSPIVAWFRKVIPFLETPLMEGLLDACLGGVIEILLDATTPPDPAGAVEPRVTVHQLDDRPSRTYLYAYVDPRSVNNREMPPS